MSNTREPRFSSKVYEEPAPLPASIPAVPEVGLSSAPLESMSFFLAAHCKDYNEDFMLCKSENTDPKHCLAEGRKVTRCALDLITKLKQSCNAEWEAHWKCYDWNNHMFYPCREQEKVFNKCVFDNLGIEKSLPDIPEGQTPIHLKQNPLFK